MNIVYVPDAITGAPRLDLGAGCCILLPGVDVDIGEGFVAVDEAEAVEAVAQYIHLNSKLPVPVDCFAELV